MDAQTVTRPDPLTVDDIPCTVDDIPWRLQPIACLEDIDSLTLSQTEIWSYMLDLRADNRALRVTLHQSLTETARLTMRLKASTQTIIQQADVIRAFMKSERPA